MAKNSDISWLNREGDEELKNDLELDQEKIKLEIKKRLKHLKKIKHLSKKTQMKQ